MIVVRFLARFVICVLVGTVVVFSCFPLIFPPMFPVNWLFWIEMIKAHHEFAWMLLLLGVGVGVSNWENLFGDREDDKPDYFFETFPTSL